MTVYNRSRYLKAAIESILVQTEQNFDFLIWDDGSDDDSVQIAHHYADQDARIQVVAAPHRGLSRALQSAIAATAGKYLGWVDSDDLLAPTALADTIAILNTHPDIGLVYTDHYIIDQFGTGQGIGYRCQIPYSPERLLVEFMTYHFRLMRRCIYDQVGGIDASFERAEDYDLCLKLSEITSIYHLPKPLYYYRQHPGNVTNDQLEQIRWAYRASTQALKRRGLDRQYEIDLRIISQFALQRKSQPKIEF